VGRAFEGGRVLLGHGLSEGGQAQGSDAEEGVDDLAEQGSVGVDAPEGGEHGRVHQRLALLAAAGRAGRRVRDTPEHGFDGVS
jgi:hypothetical protein